MPSEFCRRCRVIRHVRVTISRRKKRDVGGKQQEIETSSFHCEVCRSFIRSEDRQISPTA